MASWVGVTTNAGARLMSNWTDGTVLNISKAVAGTGLVSEVSLLAQTALVSERQTISIVSSKIEDNGRKIKIQIQAPDEAYTLNQIALFASLDGGEQTLLALFQHEKGVPIPSVSESPDFLYTFYAFLKVSNLGDFSLTVDTTAAVSYGTMQDYVANLLKDHNNDAAAHNELVAKLEELSKGAAITSIEIEGPEWDDTTGSGIASIEIELIGADDSDGTTSGSCTCSSGGSITDVTITEV